MWIYDSLDFKVTRQRESADGRQCESMILWIMKHSGQAPRGRESGGEGERLGHGGGKTLKKYKDSLRLGNRVYAKQ